MDSQPFGMGGEEFKECIMTTPRKQVRYKERGGKGAEDVVGENEQQYAWRRTVSLREVSMSI